MTAAEPGGVTVPPELARVVARLAVLGLAEMSRRDGGAPRVPGLAALLTELSARGHEPPTVASCLPLSTSREAAALLGLSCRSARRLAASGRLIARRQGRDWLIDRESIEDYARGRRAA
jgi:excisionase family DNA binding protein